MTGELLLAPIATLVTLALLAVTGRLRFLRDELSPGWRRTAAAFLLTAILLIGVFGPASSPMEPGFDPAEIAFPSLFGLHVLFLVFLTAWWQLRGRPPLGEFLHVQPPHPLDLTYGMPLGAIAWAVSITVAGTSAYLLQSIGALPHTAAPPPIMLWLAALPVVNKLLIIAAAMTVEEAFFRGFLQPRIGFLPSTLLFAIGHASYGLPTLLLGVLAMSLVIGWAFQKTGRLLPCIIAHGVFNAIQLLVILPLASEAARQGAA